jgi:hypothetical protein
MLRQGRDHTLVRQGFLFLALIALLVKVIVPPGFMVSSHHGSALQICTGHEAMPNGDDGSQDKTAKHEAPCAFAGHALGFSPPVFDGVPLVQTLAYVLSLTGLHQDLVPGRGLAAPPPPAHAPPKI